MLKNIKMITGDAIQGMSQPYLCVAEDDVRYYVKGLRSHRSSQINEWLCANMARAIGLPVAPFELLNVPDYLYEECPEIGLGRCFASEEIAHCTLFEIGDLCYIPIDLQRKIAAFDWLVKNGDRTEGNTNLLYQGCGKKLFVIDYNMAFDTTFSAEDFFEHHIFRQAFQEVFTDWVLMEEVTSLLAAALPKYREACDRLPEEWRWINAEQDILVKYDFDFVEETLGRIDSGKLWRIK